MVQSNSHKCVVYGKSCTKVKFRHKQKLSIEMENATDLTCNIDFCSATCEDLQSHFSHLKNHIKEDKSVSCCFHSPTMQADI